LPRPVLGPTKPHIQLVPGVFSSDVKRPVRQTAHSLPYSAEVKNGGATPPLPLRLRGTVLNRVNGTFNMETYITGSLLFIYYVKMYTVCFDFF
jgi:hypothetical protein